MEVLPNPTIQEESTLKPWVDPHQLKQHQGIWYKDGRQVVTGDIEAKCHLIQSHHDSPVHGHPGISKLYSSQKDYIGGHRCEGTSPNT
jgi:hypothetical protein